MRVYRPNPRLTGSVKKGLAPGGVHKGVILRNALSGRLPSFESLRPGCILTTGSLIIMTVLWIAARFPDEIPTGFWPWRALSQLTILWSVTLSLSLPIEISGEYALLRGLRRAGGGL